MTMPFLFLAAAVAAAPAPDAPTNAAATVAFKPTDPLRNPFWPVDFDYDEKDLQAITTEPIVDVTQMTNEDEEKTAATAGVAAALAKSSRVISPRTWSDATKLLHFKGKTTVVDVMTGKKRTAFFINGNTYGIGDFISVNYEGHRFTWRLRQRTDLETLMLEQIRVVKIPDNAEPPKEGK